MSRSVLEYPGSVGKSNLSYKSKPNWLIQASLQMYALMTSHIHSLDYRLFISEKISHWLKCFSPHKPRERKRLPQRGRTIASQHKDYFYFILFINCFIYFIVFHCSLWYFHSISGNDSLKHSLLKMW